MPRAEGGRRNQRRAEGGRRNQRRAPKAAGPTNAVRRRLPVRSNLV
jgi:hypothetical protein